MPHDPITLFRKKISKKRLKKSRTHEKTIELSPSEEKELEQFKAMIETEYASLLKEKPIFKAIIGGYPLPLDKIYIKLDSMESISNLDRARKDFIGKFLMKNYHVLFPRSLPKEKKEKLSNYEISLYKEFMASLSELMNYPDTEQRDAKPTNKTWWLYYGHSEELYALGINLEVHNRTEAVYPFGIAYNYDKKTPE